VPRIEAAMKADGRKPYFLAAMFYFAKSSPTPTPLTPTARTPTTSI